MSDFTALQVGKLQVTSWGNRRRITIITNDMKKTKIVATISDKRCEVEFLEKLYRAGMNVVRLNTAHQDMEQALKVVENVRKGRVRPILGASSEFAGLCPIAPSYNKYLKKDLMLEMLLA